MKFLISFGCVFFIGALAKDVRALSPEVKSIVSEKLLAVSLECLKDYPLTVADIKSFKNKEIPEDSNAKCFTACVFKGVDIMDEEGMLSPAGARNNAEKVFKGNKERLENVDKIMELCSAVNKEKVNDCDRAKLAFECLMSNAPKYGFDLEH